MAALCGFVSEGTFCSCSGCRRAHFPLSRTPRPVGRNNRRPCGEARQVSVSGKPPETSGQAPGRSYSQPRPGSAARPRKHLRPVPAPSFGIGVWLLAWQAGFPVAGRPWWRPVIWDLPLAGLSSHGGTCGLRRVGRSPTRPVLKHGPRSLTCVRVVGKFSDETRRRNESEGRLIVDQGGIRSGLRFGRARRRTAGPSRPQRR